MSGDYRLPQVRSQLKKREEELKIFKERVKVLLAKDKVRDVEFCALIKESTDRVG